MTPKHPADDRDDAWLDDMLDDLAAAPVGDPSDALMSRVMSDALAIMPPPGGDQPKVSIWRNIVHGLGGWPAVGGLVAAAATGFVVGLGALDMTADAMAWPFGYDLLYQDQTGLDAFGWDLEEG